MNTKKLSRSNQSDAPSLTKTQEDGYLLYRRLEIELRRAPTHAEYGAAAGYAEGSERAGAQRMLEMLERKGLITKGEMRVVGAGSTELGRAVHRRLKRRRARE